MNYRHRLHLPLIMMHMRPAAMLNGGTAADWELNLDTVALQNLSE